MVMYFDRMEKIHLYKDVGMVPYYLAREFDYDLEYVTAADCEPDNFRGHAIRKLKRYPNEKYNLHFYAYLLRHARTIDVLVTLHCRDYSLMLGRIYKLLNPKGIFYIKGDYNNFTNEKIRKRLAYRPSIKDFSLGRLREKYRTRRAFARLKQVDILSIEQMEVYEDILEHGLGGQDVRAITQFLINGFDDSDQIAVKPYSEKENLMITVGTIGLPRKNNEMLLEALKTIDLGDWRIALVGPIVEPAFQVYLEDLKHSHTSLWQRIILTGNIDDRRVLYDYYNRAKVFCLTSRSEAFAMVVPEAAYFADHIVTTKVGGAAEITHKGTVGRLIEQGDIEALRQELQRVIQDPAYCQSKVEQQRQQSHEVCWSHLIRQAALFEAKLRYR
jgi:glycosyltransferase involved in cell wall biosynthesis